MERVRWQRRPTYSVPDGVESVSPRWSTDEGETWQTGAANGPLPEELDGLLSWRVIISAGQTFDGIEVDIPDADPLVSRPNR